MENLPKQWADIQDDEIYKTTNELLVSFSPEQIKLGLKYDQNSKHLKAIEKGVVAPRGNKYLSKINCISSLRGTKQSQELEAFKM